MFYMNPIHMLMLHFFTGVGIALLVALYCRSHNKIRKFFNFGEQFFGTKERWLRWYMWALFIELVESLMYTHTPMLIYEFGWSFIQAIALTLGAFVVDRAYDFLVGDIIYDKREPIHISMPQVHIKNPFEGMGSKIKSTVKSPKLDEETVHKDKEDFDNLTRGY